MRIFSKILPILTLVGCSTGSFSPDEPLTENRYIPEEDFLRISEYFTGREPLTDRVYVRSDENARGGYYWILPVDDALAAQQPLRIRLEVHRPGSPETGVFHLTSDRALDTSQTLWIGLTGEDWPTPDLGPIAWKIMIFSETEEETVLTRESYLWTKSPLLDSSAKIE